MRQTTSMYLTKINGVDKTENLHKVASSLEQATVAVSQACSLLDKPLTCIRCGSVLTNELAHAGARRSGEHCRVGSSLAQATVAVSEACSVGLLGLRQRQGGCWQDADGSSGGQAIGSQFGQTDRRVLAQELLASGRHCRRLQSDGSAWLIRKSLWRP